MKVFTVLFALVAAATAASLSNSYIPPVADNSLPTQEYIPPDGNASPAELADDGYRYKTVRRLKYRQRRDVNELPAPEYLPPTEDIQEDVGAAESIPEEKTELAEDGYRYKTVRRLKYRQRRDVNELPASKYLPPSAEPQKYLPPSEEIKDDVGAADSVPEEKTELAEDGYRYKTVRRLKCRQRRDVNELPAPEYLPPSEDIQEDVVPADSIPEEKTELAEDGYRYKTVRRLKYRQRRDVNELPASKYLPPSAEPQKYLPPSEEIKDDVGSADSVPEEKTVLAEDGYRYKTVRRLKYRQRRDVNELPTPEYLPPSEEIQEDGGATDSIPEEKTELAEDGYRYKTVRRLKYRQRRDVNELPASKYLPPSAEPQKYLPPSEEIKDDVGAAGSVPEEKTELAEDGYRYKTVRRLKYRQRRDVNELPAPEYLPPSEDIQEDVVPADSKPEEKTELAEDGYRYKTVRRLKYRQRRDVNELPASKYLPPSEEPQKYLPPSEEIQEVVGAADSIPEEKTELAEDGYRYKTVRRLKYRQRRDVNELPAPEYLPPSEEIQEDVGAADSIPEEKTELAEDGYRYKTVRRLKYRQRRDVNELPAPEYLPPSEEIQEDVRAAESIPEEKTELAEDGYRYKTVRRLKYRQRRDVNELPANDYLPPADAEQSEEISVVETDPEVKTDLADDGYRYKIVRRVKYRRH